MADEDTRQAVIDIGGLGIYWYQGAVRLFNADWFCIIAACSSKLDSFEIQAKKGRSIMWCDKGHRVGIMDDNHKDVVRDYRVIEYEF